MTFKLYNSRTQKKEVFEPLTPGKVRLYVCGVTPYDECHLGHARAAVVFDVLFRYLRHLQYDVTYVRNFTDVDDKIIKKANDMGCRCSEISEKYILSYQTQMKRLGTLDPTFQPRATEHIHEMIQLIERLITKGLAYASGGDVFYSVRKFARYGELSHKKIDELESGARIEVDDKKKDPLDFALWKSAKPGEPHWLSPWGEGRPGWHIECSAMSMKYLGDGIDIHGGGRDLMFPHHENEIAQSEGATEVSFARYWIHNGFVNINKEKMSKSLGNIRSVPAILDQWDPEIVRFFLLSSHYASPLDFTDEAMEQSKEALSRFYEAIQRLENSPEGDDSLGFDAQKLHDLLQGLQDDLNTTKVIAGVFDWVREINKALDQGKKFSKKSREEFFKTLEVLGTILGLFHSSSSEFLDRQIQKKLKQSQIDPSSIEALIQERLAARKSKNWKRADEIRVELESQGILLKDNPDGTTNWVLK